jgi:hypothetical protein
MTQERGFAGAEEAGENGHTRKPVRGRMNGSHSAKLALHRGWRNRTMHTLARD